LGGDCSDAVRANKGEPPADDEDDDEEVEDDDDDDDDDDEEADEAEACVSVRAAGATGRATDAPANLRGNLRSRRRCVSAAECCSVRMYASNAERRAVTMVAISLLKVCECVREIDRCET
jgi:hypothetical protein